MVSIYDNITAQIHLILYNYSSIYDSENPTEDEIELIMFLIDNADRLLGDDLNKWYPWNKFIIKKELTEDELFDLELDLLWNDSDEIIM